MSVSFAALLGRTAGFEPAAGRSQARRELPYRSTPRCTGGGSPLLRGAFYPSSRRASSATAGSTSLSKSAYLTLMVSVWVPALKTMISSSVNVSST
jgi:hypothetical protein